MDLARGDVLALQVFSELVLRRPIHRITLTPVRASLAGRGVRVFTRASQTVAGGARLEAQISSF